MNKFLVWFLVGWLFVPVASAEGYNPGSLPLGSFVHIPEGLPEKSMHGPVWCYDDEANARLVLYAEKEKMKCELRLTFEVEKEKIKSGLIIENLNLRIKTLITERDKILAIKDQEINRLTEITSKVPNDYSIWWASGGFVTGALVTIGIVLAIAQ